MLSGHGVHILLLMHLYTAQKYRVLAAVNPTWLWEKSFYLRYVCNACHGIMVGSMLVFPLLFLGHPWDETEQAGHKELSCMKVLRADPIPCGTGFGDQAQWHLGQHPA